MAVKRPTQSEVAKLAGVSRVTVSLVLNKHKGGRIPISEDTRQRVLDAALSLGYSPNPIAQMLALGTNLLIGVFTYEHIFPYEQDDFYYRFLSGVEREAGARDYNVLLFTRDGRLTDHQHIYQGGMNSLRLSNGAIIMGSSTNRPELARLVHEKYPFVHYGRREVPGCEIDWVAPDYKLGSYQMARHLIELGHRHMGLIQTNDPKEAFEDKLSGLQKALNENPDVDLIVMPGSFEMDALSLIEAIQSNHLSVLLCTSHTPLDSIYTLLLQNGLRIPQDISLACLSSHDRQFNTQWVTRLNINRSMAGEWAVRILIGRMKGEISDQQHIWIPTNLIEGETVAQPYPAR